MPPFTHCTPDSPLPPRLPCPLAKQKGKSPSSSKKKRELDLAPFEVPEGYALAAPPTADELEFNNDAGDALVGKHLLFNWEGVGWCEGVIEERNTSKREKIGKDHVNFWVHYAVDSNTSKHNLELDNYAADGEAEFDSWVLLDKVRSSSETPSTQATSSGVCSV